MSGKRLAPRLSPQYLRGWDHVVQSSHSLLHGGEEKIPADNSDYNDQFQVFRQAHDQRNLCNTVYKKQREEHGN